MTWRKWPVIVSVAVSLFAAVSLTRLHPDTSLDSLFNPDQPAVIALKHVTADFTSAQEMLVLATSPGAAARPDRLLAFARRFEQTLRAEPGSARVVRAVSYQADSSSRDFVTDVLAPNGVFYLSDAEFAAAMRRLTPAAMEEQLRQNAAMLAAPGPAAGALAAALLQDPLHLHEFLDRRLAAARPVQTYQNRSEFLAPNGRSLLIRVAGEQPPSDLAFCARMTSIVERAATRANTDGLQLDFTGTYPIAALSERSIRRDSVESVIGSALCLLGLFTVVFRRGLPVALVAGLPIALGVLWGFGAFAWISRGITPLTAVIGGMLAGIGIDYAVFFLVHYQRERVAGMTPTQAAQWTRRAVGGAIFAAWVTSVLGFVAVGFASVRALRDFSIVGSLSLCGAMLATLVVLPAVLAWVDRGMLARPPRVCMGGLVRWVDGHALPCMISGLVALIGLGAALVWMGPWLPLESDTTVMHPKPNPPLDAERTIAVRMGTSPDSVLVYLQAATPEGLVRAAYAVEQRLGTPAAHAAGVTSTFGLSTLLPDPQVASHRLTQLNQANADRVAADFAAALAKSPFDPAAYRPYANFLRRLLTPPRVPSVADLAPHPQLAGSILPRAGISTCEALSIVFLRPMDVSAAQSAVATLRRLLGDVPGATVTGMAVLNLDTQATIHHDLPRLTGVALAICAVYLLVHFRSVSDAALAILPSVCSMFCLLVFARAVGAKLNLANLVAAPLLVGIDIDYGIFLVSLARRSKTRVRLVEGAQATALAIVLCAAATLLGFGSLAFTSVPAVRTLGVAVVVGVGSCATAALLFLLPLLLWRAGRKAAVGAGAAVLLAVGGGCVPQGRLSFPQQPIARGGNVQWFDVHHNGRREFALGYDAHGRVDRVLYSDKGNGVVSRSYRLADYPNESVPHVFLLLDSIPFQTMQERYAAGDFRWFDPPVKLIAPFPSLTEICYSQILHAPPLPGMIDQYWDPRDGRRQNLLWARVHGYRQPWERQFDYESLFWQQGLSFLKPQEWYTAELELAHRAIDASPHRVTTVYLASAASMVCKFGRPGAERVLDGARQLCLQLLYEHRGAIKITMMADHGHNYTRSHNVDLVGLLTEAGFHPGDRLQTPLDCVVELDALVTYVGVDTKAPGAVAAALCRSDAVELAIYRQGDQAIVRSRAGTAAIECRNGLLRYRPLSADVLGYAPLLARLRAEHLADSDGFVPDSVWFQQTLDAAWPNAPRRIWDALHGEVLTTPSVLLSLKDGYYAGYSSYEKFITMESTHGGLNQINSATFAMSMTGRLRESVPHAAVIATAEPNYNWAEHR